MTPLEVGTTSWSLQIDEFEQMLETVEEDLDLHVIHLGAIADISLTEEVREEWQDALDKRKLEVSATAVGFAGEDYSTLQTIEATGGFVNPEQFEPRFRHLCDMAELTRTLGVGILTTHIGFVPGDAQDPCRAHMVESVRKVADALADRGIVLGMETGQESPDLLLAFIDQVDRENVKVNFDPANMILYGSSDPIEALDKLQDHIVHVHVKDATPAIRSGAWGSDVPLGEGEVGIDRYLRKLKEIEYRGPLIIEREGGDNRIEDIRRAVELLEELV